jgi:hypothetical protein
MSASLDWSHWWPLDQDLDLDLSSFAAPPFDSDAPPEAYVTPKLDGAGVPYPDELLEDTGQTTDDQLQDASAIGLYQ